MEILEKRYLTVYNYSSESELVNYINNYLQNNSTTNFHLTVILDLLEEEFIKAKKDLDNCNINNVSYIITKKELNNYIISQNQFTDASYLQVSTDCRYCGNFVGATTEITKKLKDDIQKYSK